jgi:hypothetical protein
MKNKKILLVSLLLLGTSLFVNKVQALNMGPAANGCEGKNVGACCDADLSQSQWGVCNNKFECDKSDSQAVGNACWAEYQKITGQYGTSVSGAGDCVDKSEGNCCDYNTGTSGNWGLCVKQNNLLKCDHSDVQAVGNACASQYKNATAASAVNCTDMMNTGKTCTSGGVTNGVCNDSGECVPAGSNAAAPSTGDGGITPPASPAPGACEPGYVNEGGICYPGNVGLSKATVSSILLNVFDWLFGIFFVLAVAAFIISGIQYLMSGGSETMIETAKRNMTWSIVGAIVGLSGMVIVNAIATALKGTSSMF